MGQAHRIAPVRLRWRMRVPAWPWQLGHEGTTGTPLRTCESHPSRLPVADLKPAWTEVDSVFLAISRGFACSQGLPPDSLIPHHQLSVISAL